MGLAAAKPAATAKEHPISTPTLEGRIFKALKGGQKRGESAEAFFGRLKSLGYHGVESGNPAEAESYRSATQKTGVRIHGLVEPEGLTA